MLKYDPERGRVSLGMKQIMPDPWASVAERFPLGTRVRGKVVSLADYGAFIELEPGVEGLVHISEMSWTKRVNTPLEGVEPGQEVDVVVLDVDPSISARVTRVETSGAQPLGNGAHQPPHWQPDYRNGETHHRFRPVRRVDEGIDGLVHISDLHWTRKIKHPSELYKKGDPIDAVVLGIDVENERIALGVKQMTEDPWSVISQRYPSAARAKGKVTTVTDFGIFVEIEEGIEGLIHVSQLSSERVEKPQTPSKSGRKWKPRSRTSTPRNGVSA